MFTSIKKWVKNEDNAKSPTGPPAGMQTMRSDLQRKFSKGVQYNLKIILRGDRNTGKTCLWHRLQGHKFVEEYVPTPEIQAASIHWNYKATDDIVKVDVWDVVDQGKAKKHTDSLKISNAPDEGNENQMLDASFLDVYKGAHAVIFVFDITKKWTFQYVENELPKVPSHIPVLVLANHRDMGGHRVVELEELQYLVEGVDRPPGSAGIMFLESSMKNGFGLKYIHKFFNLPFLLLQRESLLKQLETNYLDVESCLEELRYEPTSEEQNFDCFLDMLEQKKKGKKPTPPQATPPPSGQQKPEIPDTEGSKKPTSPPIKVQPAEPTLNGSSNSASSPKSPADKPKQHEPEKRGFMSRFFKNSPPPTTENQVASTNGESASSNSAAAEQSVVKDIDDFVPDGGAVDQFLDEIPEQKSSARHDNQDSDSSSDESDNNPMVAGFQEELDSDDQIAAGTGKVYTYSDSDEDYVAQTQKQKRSKENAQGSIKLDFSPVDELPKPQYTVTTPANEFEVEQKVLPHTEKTDDFSPTKVDLSSDEEKPKKAIDDRLTYEDVSSEDEAPSHVVSNFVEDISSDEDQPVPAVKPLKEEEEDEEDEATPASLQLQSSDFDFLEQITSKPKPAPPKESSKKSSSKKSRSPVDGDAPKKHKKKKKKHKQDEPKSTSRRARRKSEDDLEAFLA